MARADLARIVVEYNTSRKQIDMARQWTFSKKHHFRFVFYNIFIQSIHLFYHKRLFSTDLFYKPFENTESTNNYRDIFYECSWLVSYPSVYD